MSPQRMTPKLKLKRDFVFCIPLMTPRDGVRASTSAIPFSNYYCSFCVAILRFMNMFSKIISSVASLQGMTPSLFVFLANIV